MRKNKKKVLAGVLAVLLAFVAVGGTIAWLTAQNSLTNSFTVGGITDPEKDPDTDKELDPDGDDKDKLDGNLYESEWVPDSPLKPGASVDKNPNVGIGPESEDAYVFLFVKNETLEDSVQDAAKKMPYFTLNANWYAINPVSGTDSFKLGVSEAAEQGGSTAYTGGLFMYSTDSNNPAYLTASTTADVWTGEAFSEVFVPSVTTVDDFVDVVEDPDGTITSGPKMGVYSFVYAANADHSNAGEALQAARNWASGIVTGA